MKVVTVVSLTWLNKVTSVSLSHTYAGPIACVLEGWFFPEACSLVGKTRQNKDKKNTKKHSIKTQWMLKSSATGGQRNDRGRVR